MLCVQRRAKIIELLQEKGSAATNDLINLFQVDGSTIRRDLEKLDKEGIIVKTYGGAVLRRAPTAELSLVEKKTAYAEEKKRIGQVAAELIENGDTIVIDAGSTTVEVAKNLKDKVGLTVVTNALNIARDLSTSKAVTINLTGGTLSGFYSLQGPLAIKTIKDICVNKAIIGTSGISAEKGITEPSLLGAEIKTAMIKSAEEVIIVTDHSKIGKILLASVIPAEGINKLITDDGISSRDKKAFEEKGIEVIVCCTQGS